MPIKPAIFLSIFIATGLFIATAGAKSSIKPFSADYVISKKKAVIAGMNTSLTPLGEKWQYQSSAKARGVAAMFSKEEITESSLLKINGNAITPLQYRYHRSGKKNQKSVETDFDWGKQIAKVANQGEAHEIALESNMLDQHSLQLALMLDLQCGTLKPQYTVIDGAERKKLNFSKETQETIKVAGNEFDAIKLVRQHGSRETIGWYASELGYLPVKIQRFKNGKLKTELKLKTFKWLE